MVIIAATLVKLEWNGFGIADQTWALMILIVAILLVGLVLFRIRNVVFPMPVAWAYIGICQFLKTPEGFNGQFQTLQTTAIAGAVVLIIFAAIQFYRNHYSLFPEDAFK